MYPSLQEETRRQQVDDLWRLADESRRIRRAQTRRPVRIAIGARLIRAGKKLGGERAVSTAGLAVAE